MGQARRVGNRKRPTGPMPRYQQEERRFCTCHRANLRQASMPDFSFCPWPVAVVSLAAGRDGQVLPVDRSGCTSLMSVIDERPFFLLSGIDSKKVKVEPKMWSMAAGTLLESHCRLRGEKIPWRLFFFFDAVVFLTMYKFQLDFNATWPWSPSYWVNWNFI